LGRIRYEGNLMKYLKIIIILSAFLTIPCVAFIELSFHDKEISLNEWIKKTLNKLENRCWEAKHCDETNCPAYKNECGRCWLIAGTMCGGKPQGKFVEKYNSCIECEVFQAAMGDDRVHKLREFVLILIHSLGLKQLELKEALTKVKILSGFLPICSLCKKIRDDKGYWNKIETYIRNHSEAEFTHGFCPECAEKHYPELYSKESIS
jgi:hypothetical protein